VVLTGPTAAGKTAIGLALARRLSAEIISMDSRQVYRGMDIGTAKVTPEERRGVPHFGLDLIDPDEAYSAGRWARSARGWIDEIEDRGHTPLVVGGTGFFLRALLQPIFREPRLDPDRRDALRRWMDARSLDELDRWLSAIDPDRALVARAGGRQRVSRALEVALLSGRSLTWWHRTARPDGEPVPCLVVCLEVPRDELDRRIDVRASRMVEGGFVREVQALLDAGYSTDAPGMTGTGYREIASMLRGEVTLDEALDEVRRQTRRYARRQLTWFRNQLPAETLRIDAGLSSDHIIDLIDSAWREARQSPVLDPTTFS
jgi:tRNA dimethylallyltransferase